MLKLNKSDKTTDPYALVFCKTNWIPSDVPAIANYSAATYRITNLKVALSW